MKTKKVKGGWFWQDNMNVNIQFNTDKRTIQINKKSFIENLFVNLIDSFKLPPGNYTITDDKENQYFIVYTDRSNIVVTKVSGFNVNLNEYEGKTLFLNSVPLSRSLQILSNINYTFHRHGFSCNNLNKAFGSKIYQLNDIEDPSLTLYGILDILLNRDKLVSPEPAYNGFVFVSSLVRTWQTAILLHFSCDVHVNKYIIVSPFLKEKHGSNPTGNRPLIFNDQWGQMALFFSLLKQIYLYIGTEDHILCKRLKNIMESNIYIIDPIRSCEQNGGQVFHYKRVSSKMYVESNYPDDKTDYPFNKEYIELNVNDFLSNNRIPRKPVQPLSREITIPDETAQEYFKDTQYVESTNASLNGLSQKYKVDTLTSYYKEESFKLFDKWVHEIYDAFQQPLIDLTPDEMVPHRDFKDNVAFVICHSKTMQAILNYYVTPKTMLDNEKVFNTNVWSFNYYHLTNFKIKMGLSKPDPAGMSKYNEPTCNPTSIHLEGSRDYVTSITDKRAKTQLQKARTDIERRNAPDPLSDFVGGKTFKRKKKNRRTKYVKRQR
jgi:hypothetical protein